MKKITFLLSFVAVAFLCSAQVKITFEEAEIGSSGGAVAMWGGGTVAVAANTYAAGNPSSKVLHVNNTNYLPIYFSNIPIPAGAESMYSILRVKYLVIGGTDTNYPSLEIFSTPNSTDANPIPKFGNVGWEGLWGTAQLGVWKTVEFTFANTLLTPIPAGNLVLKLSKSNTEYLIDDVELVPIPVATPIFTLADFESNTIGDILNMRRYSPTDATATVEANPTIPTQKSVHILATNWNSALRMNVVLPTGKVLADYDKLTFDIYLNNIEGTDNVWKNTEVYVGASKVINIQSAGVANAWETRNYTLNNLEGGNAFVMDIGVSTNKANYYLDNIKLTQKLTSFFPSLDTNPLFIYNTSNAFVLNQTVDTFELYNAQGSLLTFGNKVNSINSSNFKNGVYILKATINGEKFITKLLK